MIVEAILKLFINLAIFILDLLPVFDLTGVMGGIDAFMSILDLAAYFLPMNTVTTILGIILLEESIKIAISIGKLILKLIPFVG